MTPEHQHFSGSATVETGDDDADALLRLALSQPGQALHRAQEILDRHPGPGVASVARQTIGIVLRDGGDLPAALTVLRAAARSARASGDDQRLADVRGTWGAALVMAGRTSAGLEQLDLAAATARGPVLARVRLRRAHVLSLLGRHEEALVDLRRAMTGFRRHGDGLWQARALANRSLMRLALGDVGRAESDAEQAHDLFAAIGQDLEAVQAAHNLALVAFRRGDLPGTLSRMHLAAQRYAELGIVSPDLAANQCSVLLTAGLAADAVAVVRTALLAPSIQASRRAELLLTAGSAALAAGDPAGSLAYARDAQRRFRRQKRDWWTVRAALLGAQARFAAGERGPRLYSAAAAVAAELAREAAEEAPAAALLAGRLASDADRAAGHFAAAARHRSRGPSLTRAAAWLAQALRCRAAGRSRGVLSACGRGLDALDEHRLTLGASDLQAHATGHGRELAGLALAESLRPGDGRRLLRWSERWRATALAAPPVRPPDDTTLVRDLAALRDVSRRLDRARATGAATAVLERERTSWEVAVRRQRHHLSGQGGRSPRLDLDQLFAALGDTTLVELVEADGTLHALVARRGRVRRQEVGPADRAAYELQLVEFLLRKIAHRRPGDVTARARRLQEAVLGPAAARFGAGPLVVVPPARFLAVPWGLLPAVADAPVAVSPSAAMWLRAALRPPPAQRRVVLVAGPDLVTGGAEVPALAETTPAAAVLRNGTARVEDVLAALDGAWLAHLAAHGTFRRDNPLFSCLQMDDGPLLVHDLERLRSGPYRILLSACESAMGAPVGADEVLGLVGCLLSLGAAGVLASVTAVDDEATVPLMLTIHAALRSGLGLDHALLAARREASGDPLASATAASFLALGV